MEIVMSVWVFIAVMFAVLIFGVVLATVLFGVTCLQADELNDADYFEEIEK